MPSNVVETQLATWLSANSVGWTVVASRDRRGAWLVSLDHPASAGLRIETGATDALEATRIAMKCIKAADEITTASAAPALEHRDLVMEVRTIAQVFDWHTDEIRAVAFMLFSHGHISRGEAAWMSGFLGHGAPRHPVDPVGE